MVDFGMDLQSCITMFEKPLGNIHTLVHGCQVLIKQFLLNVKFKGTVIS